MLLSGYDGKRWEIGYAYSIDGKAFQKSTDNPFFDPSLSGWDSISVQLPIMVTKGNASYLFYAGAGPGYQEGVAISTTLAQAK